MAYNNKYISIRPVIESVYRDSGIDEINFETAIEDAAELIGLIGIPYTYVDKVTDGLMAPFITVSEYRAELPADLVYVVSMSKATIDSNSAIMALEEMLETTSLTQYSRLNTSTDSNYMLPSAVYPVNEIVDDELITEDGVVIGYPAISVRTNTYGYKLNNNVVFTDFESGYIVLSYKAFPTDDDGLLQIPDDEKFRVALKYHMMYKIDFRRWRAFPEKPGLKALLNDSQQQRDFYVAAARNKAHIPTVDRMEAMKNRHLTLIPKINQHRNGFNTLNNQERRRF